MEEKMKKTRIILICTLVIAFACVLLAGCSKTERISSIELKDHDPQSAIEFQLGKFDWDAYTLAVNYDSGSVVEVAVSEDMISELDRLKFYQPGDHTITISYGGETCEIKISVKRDTFGELYFPENTIFTFDGKAHTVEIEGELPSNATVSYVGGNSFVNAGTYDVTAVVTCNGYVTKRISTTVIIERAKYDMSGVKFESKDVVYDGKAHTIEISGKLPDGVGAPTYYINGSKTVSAVDANQYTVTAVFPNSNPNYDVIPTMTATLNIIPAKYDLGEVDIIFKDAKGSAYFFPYKTYDGEKVTFELSDNGSLKKKVSVSYVVYDEEGSVISVSNTETNIKNAGVYTVEVQLTLLDGKNYKPLDPVVCKFEVAQAEFDTSGLAFESKAEVYNGEMHSLLVDIPVSMDVTKFDVSYEYYFAGDDEIIKDRGKNVEGVIGAGEYTVRAVFTVNDPNYEPIPAMEAKLVIEKMEISADQFSFYDTNQVYDKGEALYPKIRGSSFEYVTMKGVSFFKLEEGEYVPVDHATDVGTYQVRTTISLKDTQNLVFDNGSDSVELVSDFTVREATIDISEIEFDSGNLAIVIRGNVVEFKFNTAGIEGLTFAAEVFKAEDLEVGTEDGGEEKPTDQIAEKNIKVENGVMIVEFDTANLETGDYVIRITVSADSSNFVLSNGNATAEYDFEFKIAN